MKKCFIILILPFLFFSLVSCRSDALKLFEHGEYQKAIDKVDSMKHPGSEDYLAKARSLVELGRKSEANESVLMYLLTTNHQSQTTDRQFAVDFFLSCNFSNEITVLCLVPEDGLESQIALYKAYSKLGDSKNARQIVDTYLSLQLSNTEILKLMIDYPSDSTFTMGIFENWFESLTNQEKQPFAELLYAFSQTSDLSEQCARSIIHICQANEKDKFYTTSKVALSTVFKTHSKASALLKDFDTSKQYLDKANNLK